MHDQPTSGNALLRRICSVFRRSACSLPLAVCVVAAIAGLAVVDDYGVSVDEESRRLIGARAADYVLGKNDEMLHHFDRVMGVAFELPLYIVEHVLGLDDSRSVFLARHLLSHWFFVASGFFCALLTLRLTNSRSIAVVTMLLFMLHPRLYAHSFFNTKDVPFAGMFMISLYVLWRAFDRSAWRSFVLAGVAVGCLTSMRVMGLALVFGATVLQLLDVAAAKGVRIKRRRCGELCAFLGAAALTLYATWPYLWADPLARFAESLSMSASHPLGTAELVNGERVSSQDLPAWYASAWFAVTTPPYVLFLGLVGAAWILGRSARRPVEALRNGRFRFQLLIVGCLVAPVLAVVVLRPTLFNGWRHLYFAYAPFALLAGVGLHELASRIRSKQARIGIVCMAGVGLVVTVAGMIRLHPYQHVYFNALVDKSDAERLAEQYELDYWHTAYREAFEFLLSRRPDQQVYVQGQFGASMRQNGGILRPEERARLAINQERADFFVAVYADRGQSNWRPVFGPVLHSRKLYNSTIMEVAAIDLADAPEAEKYHRAYETYADATPLVRSGYDVYADEGGLAYLKEACDASDTGTVLFVHVVPADAGDLLAHRRLHGYLGGTHPFGRFGARFGGKCLMRVPLPDFPIFRVRTGSGGGGSGAWEAVLDMDAAKTRDGEARKGGSANETASTRGEATTGPKPAARGAASARGEANR